MKLCEKRRAQVGGAKLQIKVSLFIRQREIMPQINGRNDGSGGALPLSGQSLAGKTGLSNSTGDVTPCCEGWFRCSESRLQHFGPPERGYVHRRSAGRL